jgi:hypothetical protein
MASSAARAALFQDDGVLTYPSLGHSRTTAVSPLDQLILKRSSTPLSHRYVIESLMPHDFVAGTPAKSLPNQTITNDMQRSLEGAGRNSSISNQHGWISLFLEYCPVFFSSSAFIFMLVCIKGVQGQSIEISLVGAFGSLMSILLVAVSLSAMTHVKRSARRVRNFK